MVGEAQIIQEYFLNVEQQIELDQRGIRWMHLVLVRVKGRSGDHQASRLSSDVSLVSTDPAVPVGVKKLQAPTFLSKALPQQSSALFTLFKKSVLGRDQ